LNVEEEGRGEEERKGKVLWVCLFGHHSWPLPPLGSGGGGGWGSSGGGVVSAVEESPPASPVRTTRGLFFFLSSKLASMDYSSFVVINSCLRKRCS
jgi:hypothetical protein